MQIPVNQTIYAAPVVPKLYTMALSSTNVLGERNIYHFVAVAIGEQDCMIRALNHMSKHSKDVYLQGTMGTPWEILNSAALSYEEIQKGFRDFGYPSVDTSDVPRATSDHELNVINTVLAYCIKNKDKRTASVLEPFLTTYERQLLADALELIC